MSSDKIIEQLSDKGIEYLFLNRGTREEKTFLIRGKGQIQSNKMCAYMITDGKLSQSVFFDFKKIQSPHTYNNVNTNTIFKTNSVSVKENFDKKSENK